MALYLDGLTIAERTVIVALAPHDRRRHPRSHWACGRARRRTSTVCTELLQHLLDRGLLIQGKLLCVIDGGKGLRRALLTMCSATPCWCSAVRCAHSVGTCIDHLPASQLQLRPSRPA